MTRKEQVSFEQATIKVEKETQFAELRSAIEGAFSSQNVEKLLKRLDSRSIRIRDFDSVLEKQTIEHVDTTLRQTGKTAKGLYLELTLTDQGQMREFYLSKLEQVDAPLRHKFHKVFQYY
jgi:hypothetical protein